MVWLLILSKGLMHLPQHLWQMLFISCVKICRRYLPMHQAVSLGIQGVRHGFILKSINNTDSQYG